MFLRRQIFNAAKITLHLSLYLGVFSLAIIPMWFPIA